MTLSIEDKRTLSEYRLKKAEKLLKDAQLLLKEERYNSTINRSYYAALSAAKGILILFGVDPKSHEGVKTQIGKHIIIGGYAGNEYAKWLRNLNSNRDDADYADYVEMDRNDADIAFKNASDFVEKSNEISRRIINEIKE